MKIITLDFIRYQAELKSVLSASQQINSSVSSDFTVGECRGVTLSKYVEKLKEISTLLEKYQVLVEKDTKAMSNAGLTLIEQDKHLAK